MLASMQATATYAKASLMRRPLLITVSAVTVAVTSAAAIASAGSFTLRVRKNVHVTNASTAAFALKPVDKHEAVAVGPAGFPVYTFQGETTHHLICHRTSSSSTNCWGFWPPVSVRSAKGLSKAHGIRGKLGTFKIHGIRQLTLNGQPLYYFQPDLMSGNKRQAQGDELKTFGSIWHVVVAHVRGAAAGGGSGSTSTTSTSGSGTGYGPGW
jgi:predicted lipoprotein with Yx(FWY)xxD motif